MFSLTLALRGLLLWPVFGSVCAAGWAHSVQPMTAGVHYAEFTFLEKGRYGFAEMGVVGERTATGCRYNPEWMLRPHMYCRSEQFPLRRDELTSYLDTPLYLGVTGGGSRQDYEHSCEGMPQFGELQKGDAVGLRLDFGQRTLSVYLNGSYRSVIMAPGMWHGCGCGCGNWGPMSRITGPLRWAVRVQPLGAHPYGALVRIERKPPPPPPTRAVVVAAVACNRRDADRYRNDYDVRDNDKLEAFMTEPDCDTYAAAQREERLQKWVDERFQARNRAQRGRRKRDVTS